MRIRSFCFCVIAPLVASAALATSSVALAQDPHPKAQSPAAQPPPLPPPAQPAAVTPAPGQAAAAAPAPAAVAITATCSLGSHPGVEESEAQTAADVVCHELARQRATNTQHEVRFGQLGGKTLVTVASRDGNTYDERRTLITGMDEINIASPRLVTALVEGKALEETRSVDNVLSSETRRAKVQQGSMGFDGGMFGTTGIGVPSGASAGVALGLLYRAGSFGVGSQGRAGGIGSGERKIGLATLDLGARYYLSDGDVSPFIGAGVALSYFKLNREQGSDPSGSGFGAYAQIGAELLRTHQAAFSVSVRADTPFYKLATSSGDDRGLYLIPVSFNVGLLFH